MSEEFVEPFTLEELCEWSRGRWMAEHCEQADLIKQRADALVRVKFPNKVLERDEATGELKLMDKKKDK